MQMQVQHKYVCATVTQMQAQEMETFPCSCAYACEPCHVPVPRFLVNLPRRRLIYHFGKGPLIRPCILLCSLLHMLTSI